jgi:Tol biopolymer transport system component
VVNADGTGARAVTKLTAALVQHINPVWTPDGAKIIFVGQRALDGSDANSANSTFNIWIVNSDGSNAVPLTKLTAPGASSLAPNQASRISKIIN